MGVGALNCGASESTTVALRSASKRAVAIALEAAVLSTRNLASSLSMRQLSDSVAAIEASLRIDLIGRTNPTGTDATISRSPVFELSR